VQPRATARKRTINHEVLLFIENKR